MGTDRPEIDICVILLEGKVTFNVRVQLLCLLKGEVLLGFDYDLGQCALLRITHFKYRIWFIQVNFKTHVISS